MNVERPPSERITFERTHPVEFPPGLFLASLVLAVALAGIQVLLHGMGPEVLLAAGMGATTLFLLAFATWRISHSQLVGIAVALAVALDPSGLLNAMEQPLVYLGWVLASLGVLLATVKGSAGQTLSAIPFTVASFLNPPLVLLAIAISPLILVRGHIYAGPRHLVQAGLPFLGAAIGAFTSIQSGFAPACTVSASDVFQFQTGQAFESGLALQNPLLQLVATLTILGTVATGILFVGAQFRLSRQLGRFQVRLQDSSPSVALSRAAWLALLGLAGGPLTIYFGTAAAATWIRGQVRDSLGFAIMLWLGLIFVLVAPMFGLYELVRGGVPADLDSYLPWWNWRVQDCTI